ncbi:MAG: sialidase family protein [Actinomycetaceae bacterium]|nr:sialidase family protein [Actinomycetaceae bacterium]
MGTEKVSAFSKGTISFDFRAKADTLLFASPGAPHVSPLDFVGKTDEDAWLRLEISGGQLVYQSWAPRQSATLECEDIHNLLDGDWHSLAVSVDEDGTRLYIDGYQEFCGTTTVFLGDLPGAAKGKVTLDVVSEESASRCEIREWKVTETVLSDKEIAEGAIAPRPLIQFATNELSAYDVRQVGELFQGTILTRFRVRGRGQEGTILAAAGASPSKSDKPTHEVMRISVNENGITYAALGRYGLWRTFTAEGSWTDGKWHDLAVNVGRGAVQIYVDGYRHLHAPGQAFFADLPALERIVIGQDTRGRRLFGEASEGYIFASPLNDSQLKAFSKVMPVPTVALMDRGLEGATSYRIPSLVTLPSGVVIAGADRRNTIPNDTPNDIDFVIRRSLDGGHTWQDTQTVATLPGEGLHGAAYTDSALLFDRNSGAVLALLDLYPGGCGQPNDQGGVGMDARGRLQLQGYGTENSGKGYTLMPDGTVLDAAGDRAPYQIDEGGNVTYFGGAAPSNAGNIYLDPAACAGQQLRLTPTSYLVMFRSFDEGATWDGPIHLNAQVKLPWMRFLGVCPGNGIQLRRGAHAGRLVVPVYFGGEVPMRFSTSTVYSDDGGATWQLSDSPNQGRELDGQIIDPRTFSDERACLYESAVVEREDGTVVMFMRNQHPSGRMAVTVSTDGATTWEGVDYHPQIPEIFSQPAAINWDGADRIVFANASALLPFRGAGVLRLSEDGGRTFQVSRTFRPYHYVYQALTVLPGEELGLLWEHEWQGLYFSRLPKEWFT